MSEVHVIDWLSKVPRRCNTDELRSAGRWGVGRGGRAWQREGCDNMDRLRRGRLAVLVWGLR